MVIRLSGNHEFSHRINLQEIVSPLQPIQIYNTRSILCTLSWLASSRQSANAKTYYWVIVKLHLDKTQRNKEHQNWEAEGQFEGETEKCTIGPQANPDRKNSVPLDKMK